MLKNVKKVCIVLEGCDEQLFIICRGCFAVQNRHCFHGLPVQPGIVDVSAMVLEQKMELLILIHIGVKIRIGIFVQNDCVAPDASF